jgi:hypothetical protein
LGAFLLGCGERSRAGLRYALLLICLLALGFLPPHDEASSAENALEVSGEEITYNGSPMPFPSY